MSLNLKSAALPHPARTQAEFEARYPQTSFIGRGTYGQVFQAKDQQSSSTVAIKIIDISSEARARVALRELYIMRRLTQLIGNEPFPIVKLLDAQIDLDRPALFIVMEHIEDNLANFALHRRLELQDLLGIAYQLSCALKFLHAAGIVHRDIKPENVLIDEHCNVKLCDFGLARTLVDKCPDLSSLHKAEAKPIIKKLKRKLPARRLTQHVCSRAYRPPEVILLEPSYGEPVDMWGLGCILFELLFKGTHPEFDHSTSLFHATSCYPLSPEGKTPKDDDMSEDLLVDILGTLGKQTSTDLSFITSASVEAYVRRSNPTTSKIDFTKELDHEYLARLVGKLVKVNPYLRYSALRTVGCSIFNSVRQSRFERLPEERISDHEIDKPGMFDYDDYKSKHSLEEIQEYLLQEAALMQQN